MKPPPLLPEETLRRVLRLSQFDGMFVLLVPGFLALTWAAAGDLVGMAIGLLVAAAGAVELHGSQLLRAGQPRGMTWLIASQPYLMAILLAFCAWRFASYNPELMRAAVDEEMKARIASYGYGQEAFLRLTYNLSCALIAALTLFYQGGMTLYYYRRRAAVMAAFRREA
jgi:hypothetical protein